MNQNSEILLELTRWGLGTNSGDSPVLELSRKVEDWDAVKILANKQHVLAIAYDGIDRIYEEGLDIDIPKQILRKWYGNALKYTDRFEKYCRTLSHLAHIYRTNGFKMMLLKGYGLSMDYPIPEHRPLGDMDIYLFGKQKDADAMLSSKYNVKIDNTHSIHSVFHAGGFTVENHYDFFNTTAHPSNREINNFLKKEAASDKIRQIRLGDETACIPGTSFNAIYILRHTAQHFAAVEINIRHLLDWGMFVKAHGSEMDWDDLIKKARHFNMDRFLALQNAILKDYLGFDASLFPAMEVDKELEEKVITEILEPSFTEEHPKRLLSTIAWKWRRWRANAWKNEMVYSEGPVRTFFAQILSHIAKPETFRI